MKSESAPPSLTLESLPEYGSGGDPVGVRRLRRAFRYSVIAVLLLTGGLWYLENSYRYDLQEGKYRFALTLDPQSARPVLRQTVAMESENGGKPTARYVAALAVREEEDRELEVFEEARSLDPNNGALLVQYGNALFRHGRYSEARERYREAGLQPPRNALPFYLEAAALAVNGGDSTDWDEVMSLIGRGNNAQDPVLFPEPLWHPSLPQSGDWYWRLRESHVDAALAPLYVLRTRVLARAKAAISGGDAEIWKTWLPHLEQMGRRFIGTTQTPDAQLGYPQAVFGVQLAGDAMKLETELEANEGTASATPDLSDLDTLAQAMRDLTEYQNERLRRVEKQSVAVAQPGIMIIQGFGILLGAYLLSLAAVWFSGARSGAGTRPHPMPMRVYLLMLAAVWMGLLFGYDLFMLPLASPETIPVLHLIWRAALILALAAGLIYAAFSLPSPRAVLKDKDFNPTPETVRAARRVRTRAAIMLFRRYCGAVLGGYLAAVCGYFIFFRLWFGQYPLIKLNMLIQDARPLELATLHAIIEKLY